MRKLDSEDENQNSRGKYGPSSRWEPLATK